MAEVEKIVNDRIAEGIALDERRSVPIDQAKELGAMMLFGEKYGDEVRVITFDKNYSVELCGGIHVQNTAEIRLLKVVSESSISAGVRRIEAYTSDRAAGYLNEKFSELQTLHGLLKSPRDAASALQQLIDKSKKLEKELEKLQAAQVGDLKEGLVNSAVAVGERMFIGAVISVPSAKEMKGLAFELRQSLKNTVVVLGAVANDKPLLNVILSEDLDGSDLNAGNMIREIAREIQGGGGGQPHFASAGGKDASGLERAIAKAKAILEG